MSGLKIAPWLLTSFKYFVRVKVLKLLLDTHALLWWWTDDAQLPVKARAAIMNPDHAVLVNAASAWEIATKHRISKLAMAEQALRRFDELVQADGFEHLPIHRHHAVLAGGYAHDHRDPFDRMLAAQSEIEDAVLVTRDPAFALFGTRVPC